MKPLIAFFILSMISVSIASAEVPTEFSDELVFSGMTFPMALAHAESTILVAEREGVIWECGTTCDTLGVIDSVLTSGEGALFSVAVTQGHILTAHLASSDTSVVLLKHNMDLEDPVELLRAKQAWDTHNGGDIAVLSDESIVLSLGDDFAGACAHSQDSTDIRGGLVRMDLNGNPLSNNPWFETAPLSYTMGERNPFRMAADPLTDAIYVGNVGGSLWEEVNEVPFGGGGNYGWPFWEGSSDTLIASCPIGAPVEVPYYEYENSDFLPASVIVGLVYRLNGGENEFPPIYDGTVWVADNFQHFIRVLKNGGLLSGVNATDWGTVDPVPVSVTDMLQEADGSILYTHWTNGEVRRISYSSTLGTPSDSPTPPVILMASPWRTAWGRPDLDNETEVYTVLGQKVTEFYKKPGIYFVVSGGETQKVSVIP